MCVCGGGGGGGVGVDVDWGGVWGVVVDVGVCVGWMWVWNGCVCVNMCMRVCGLCVCVGENGGYVCVRWGDIGGEGVL